MVYFKRKEFIKINEYILLKLSHLLTKLLFQNSIIPPNPNEPNVPGDPGKIPEIPSDVPPVIPPRIPEIPEKFSRSSFFKIIISFYNKLMEAQKILMKNMHTYSFQEVFPYSTSPPHL